MIKSEGYKIEVLEDYVYVEDIASKVAKENRKGDVSLVVIDYLQLSKTRQKTNNREREVGEMSWAFKMIAKKNNLPVLLLSQLSRAVDTTQTHPCLLYTSPSPRDRTRSRMPSSA